MENEFTSVMANQSDRQLVAIVTTDRHKYQPLALEAAEKELATRNISPETYNSFHKESLGSWQKALDFEMRYADGGIRLANLVIDTIVIIVLYFLSIVAMALAGFGFDDASLLPMVIYFFVYFAYYTSMECAWQQTIGKLITSTKVVTMTDSEPTNGDIIARTFCRFIPFDWISFLFTRQGFHDSISKTTVVRK